MPAALAAGTVTAETVKEAFRRCVSDFLFPELLALSLCVEFCCWNFFYCMHFMQADADSFEARCEKRHLFLSFPYVCPEPVLAK
jgi:hypothetical protein